MVRFRRQLGHDPAPVSDFSPGAGDRQNLTLFVNFITEPRSFPIRKADSLEAERMEVKDAMVSRKKER